MVGCGNFCARHVTSTILKETVINNNYDSNWVLFFSKVLSKNILDFVDVNIYSCLKEKCHFYFVIKQYEGPSLDFNHLFVK